MLEDVLHKDGNEAFRDRMSNTRQDGRRNWFYVSPSTGKYTRWRTWLNYIYFAAFFTMPFIKWNGRPFFMFNFSAGEFILFGKIFWPQDFFIFAVGMITFIIFIILFTAIYGRLFCGWICPQTVFLEGLFRKLEWWIEGSPSQQRKLDQMPWNAEKIRTRGLKHFVFLVVSFLIANTFLAYMISIDHLFKIISEPISQHLALLTGIVVFTLVFYGVFAFVREIVCTTICPYGRLQSVLIDQNTMQVSYDFNRGEPRGKLSKKEVASHGDCIDCKKCVLVCPTGIDIRDGIQMECVGCTACIDACDEVMLKIHRPMGLIRYASEKQIKDREPFKLTTRIKSYSVLLVSLVIVMGAMIGSSKPISANVSRVKGQLYQELPGNKISNLYEAKVLNKKHIDVPVELKLLDMKGTVKMIDKDPILKKQALTDLVFFIELDKDQVVKRNNELRIALIADGEAIDVIKTTFLGPFK